MNSDDRTVQRISESVRWITDHFGLYNQRRLDYRRGNLPTNSMPEHVSGSGEPNMPELDDLERHVADGWRKIKANLETARVALRGAESEMAFLVNATKRPTDPDPVYCANPGCPDGKVWSMMPGDKPQRSDRRCEACHKWWERKQYERGFKHYALDGEAS